MKVKKVLNEYSWIYLKIAVLLCLLFLFTSLAFGQSQPKVMDLQVGSKDEKEIKGGDSQTYSITITKGYYLHAVVDQKGIDLAVEVIGPNGKLLATIDSPNGPKGPEPVFFIADTSGQYKLNIKVTEEDAPAGRYVITIKELHEATQKDITRVSAQKTFIQADELRSQPTEKNLQESIKKYEEVIKISKQIDDSIFQAQALLGMGTVYDLLGDKRKELNCFQQSLELFENNKDTISQIDAAIGIGKVYVDLATYKKALEQYKKVLPLVRSENDTNAAVDIISTIGTIYGTLGEENLALDYHNQALQVVEQIKETRLNARLKAQVFSNIGVTYDTFGEKQKALKYFTQALPLRREATDIIGEAATLYNIGNIYRDLAREQDAFSFYDKALSLYKTVGDPSGTGTTLNSFGITYLNIDELNKGLKYFQQALPLLRKAGDKQAEATALNYLGLVYDKQRKTKQAFYYFNRALRIRKTIGDKLGETKTSIGLGNVCLKLRNYRQSSKLFSNSLTVSEKIFYPSGRASSLYGLARADAQQGKLMEAVDKMQVAIKIVEQLRSNITSKDLRSSYFSTVKDYYDFYIGLLIKLHKRSPEKGYSVLALEASEKARSRSLLELLAEANADIRQGVDSKLLEHEQILRQQLNAKAQQQAQLPDDEDSETEAVELQKDIDNILRELDDISVEIKNNNPHYSNLIQPTTVNLTEIQQKVLDSDTLLLEYFLSEQNCYVWVVTDKECQVFELPSKKSIEMVAKQVKNLMTVRNSFFDEKNKERKQMLIAKAEAKLPQTIFQLSRMVLGPIEKFSDKKRLLVVADGVLQYIPFGTLVKTKENVSKANNEYVPLLINYDVVYTPSISVSLLQRNEIGNRTSKTEAIAVLADPVFELDDERFNSGQKTDSKNASKQSDIDNEKRIFKKNLEKANNAENVSKETNNFYIPRLKYTGPEAEAILSLAKTKQSFIGFDANRTTVTSDELSKYSYVHFATHGAINCERPELSALLLSMYDKEGKNVDGFLRSHELFNLNLPAELVVLSACETGLGKDIKGEGIVGLTRGFMYAGTKRIVVSLWSVNDKATAELMSKFYQKIFENKLSPASALKEAQKEMFESENWKSPYFWAPFILQGDWK